MLGLGLVCHCDFKDQISNKRYFQMDASRLYPNAHSRAVLTSLKLAIRSFRKATGKTVLFKYMHLLSMKAKQLSDWSEPEIREKLSLAAPDHNSAKGHELLFKIPSTHLVTSLPAALTVNCIMLLDGFMMWTNMHRRVKHPY